MGLLIAFKAFFRALKDKKGAQQFLSKTEASAEASAKKKTDSSHLRLLSLLQQKGRLIDFLKEDIAGFTDAQIGAAVRQIHDSCGKSLEDLLTIRPVFQEREGETVTIPEGYDASEIRLVGKVMGSGPYQGRLVHRGWKAHKQSLPSQVGEQQLDVLAPAEIELS